LAIRAVEGTSTDEWGPVRRGFAVWLADGRRGSVADIRLGRGGAVELLVATGLFFRTVVTVRAGEIEAILPRERRLIVGRADDGCHEPRLEAGPSLGAPVRLPVKRASSTESPPDAA
jgi:hypothetical protein